MPRKPKAQIAPNPLLEQLRFVGSILSKKGEPNETCCIINNGTITAQNTPLSVGILTEAAIQASPPCHQLIAALERCKDGYSMTELRGTIALASGPLRVNLPTVEGLVPAQPDPYAAGLRGDLFAAVAEIMHIADEEAEFIEASCIAIHDGLASAVNEHRSVIMQIYHGIDIPTMMIPVRFFKRLAAIGKVVTGFGYSNNAFTVFFDDNSWLRTALGACEPLPYSRVCDKEGGFKPIPDIWEAVETIMPFRGNTDSVRFGSDKVATDTASHECLLGETIRINADYLKACKFAIENYAVDNGKFYFYKGNVRGVIALME